MDRKSKKFALPPLSFGGFQGMGDRFIGNVWLSGVIAIAKARGFWHIDGMDSYLHPVQIDAWRQMSFEEKWALSKGAQRMVRNAARNRIRRTHPDWSLDQVERELAQFCARART